MSLLEMSISAGLLVIAIVLIRVIALNKLPKVAFLVLWGVVLVRLLVPVAIPMPFGINFQSVLTEAISTVSPNNSMSNISEAEQNGLYWFTLGRVATGELGRDETMQGQVPNIALVAIVWLIGVVALLTFFAVVCIKNHRGLRFAIKIHNNDFIDEWPNENRLIRRISILQSDIVTTPLAVGLFKPRIILPKSVDLSDTELLSHILMHEYYHIKRLDALWKMLMLLAVCIHWFNPLMWVMFILASRDMEITCDEMVIRHFGQDSKTAYAYSIIGMAEMRSKYASLYNGFSKNAAKERIESIMKMKKTGIIGKIAALAMVFALTIGTMTIFAADRQDYEFILPDGTMTNELQTPALPNWWLDLARERGLDVVEDEYGRESIRVIPGSTPGVRLDELRERFGYDFEFIPAESMDAQTLSNLFNDTQQGILRAFPNTQGLRTFASIEAMAEYLGMDASEVRFLPASNNQTVLYHIGDADEFIIIWMGVPIDLLADPEIYPMIQAGATFNEVFAVLFTR